MKLNMIFNKRIPGGAMSNKMNWGFEVSSNLGQALKLTFELKPLHFLIG